MAEKQLFDRSITFAESRISQEEKYSMAMEQYKKLNPRDPNQPDWIKEEFPGVSSWVDEVRNTLPISDDSIYQAIQQNIDNDRAVGYSDEEINKHYGITEQTKLKTFLRLNKAKVDTVMLDGKTDEKEAMRLITGAADMGLSVAQFKTYEQMQGLPNQVDDTTAGLLGIPKTNMYREANVGRRAVGGFINGAVNSLAVGSLRSIEWLAGSQWAEQAADKVESSMSNWYKEDILLGGEADTFDSIANGFGSTAAFMVPGSLIARGAKVISSVAPWVGRFAGASTSAAMESMVEAGTVFDQVYKRTGDKVLASTNATWTFWMNMPTNVISDKLAFFSDNAFIKKMFRNSPKIMSMGDGVINAMGKIVSSTGSGLSEGIQETMQGLISSHYGDGVEWGQLDVIGTFWEQGLPAVVSGGLVGSIMNDVNISQEIKDDIARENFAQMKKEFEAIVVDFREKANNAGMDVEQSEAAGTLLASFALRSALMRGETMEQFYQRNYGGGIQETTFENYASTIQAIRNRQQNVNQNIAQDLTKSVMRSEQITGSAGVKVATDINMSPNAAPLTDDPSMGQDGTPFKIFSTQIANEQTTVATSELGISFNIVQSDEGFITSEISNNILGTLESKTFDTQEEALDYVEKNVGARLIDIDSGYKSTANGTIAERAKTQEKFLAPVESWDDSTVAQFYDFLNKFDVDNPLTWGLEMDETSPFLKSALQGAPVNVMGKEIKARFSNIDKQVTERFNNGDSAGVEFFRQAKEGSVTDESLYATAGARAETANLPNLSNAKQMLREGRKMSDILASTGWQLDTKDNMWKFIIPGDRTAFKFPSGADSSGDTMLGEIYVADNEHPGVRKLYEAYPWLSTIKIKFVDSSMPYEGNFDIISNTMSIKTEDTEEMISTVIHEMQHAIQLFEGFAVGGSPANYQTRYLTQEEKDRAIHETFRDTNYLLKQMNIAYEQNKNPKLKEEINKIKAAVKEARDLIDLIKKNPKRKIIIYDDRQYRMLSGEIEARVAEAVSFLSAEQQSQMPIIDNDGRIISTIGLDTQYDNLSSIPLNDTWLKYLDRALQRGAMNEGWGYEPGKNFDSYLKSDKLGDLFQSSFKGTPERGENRFSGENITEPVIQTNNNDDNKYFQAIEAGDMETAQSIVDSVAKKKGYLSLNDFRMNHQAPNSHDEDVPVNLLNMKSGIVPNNYWTHPQNYQNNKDDYSSFYRIKAVIEKAEKGLEDNFITMYRAVPKDVKEDTFRNGDWITPSREYAVGEGANIPGGYRIIEKKVKAKDVWWDANSINEFGYDDGSTYAYKNTKNNRKLTDVIVRDNDGNIIPPSKRFNTRRHETFYQNGKNVNVDSNNVLYATRGIKEGELIALLSGQKTIAPSLAISKPNQEKRFGQITLILNKDSITPENDVRNKVMPSDFASSNSNANYDFQSFYNSNNNIVKTLFGDKTEMPNSNSLEDIVKYLAFENINSSSKIFKMYLKNNGIGSSNNSDIDSLSVDEYQEYKFWSTVFLSSILNKQYQVEAHPVVFEEGNYRRDYNPDNAIISTGSDEDVARAIEQADEVFFSSLNNTDTPYMNGKGTIHLKQLRSIEDIQNNRNNVSASESERNISQTQYMEAKLYRPVGIDEVKGVVLPDTTADWIKVKLSDLGIRYKEYSGNNKTIIESELSSELDKEVGNIYFQSENNEVTRLGAYNPELALTSYFEGANAFTMIHELSHPFFLDLEDWMENGTPDEQTRKDWETLRKYVGAQEGQRLTIEHHEKLAKTFERYVESGKAPSVGLQHIFDKFREWLKDLYSQAKEEGIEINDDVREVFDHMFATPEQIEEKRISDNVVGDTPDDEVIGPMGDDDDFEADFAADVAEMDKIANGDATPDYNQSVWDIADDTVEEDTPADQVALFTFLQEKQDNIKAQHLEFSNFVDQIIANGHFNYENFVEVVAGGNRALASAIQRRIPKAFSKDSTMGADVIGEAVGVPDMNELLRILEEGVTKPAPLLPTLSVNDYTMPEINNIMSLDNTIQYLRDRRRYLNRLEKSVKEGTAPKQTGVIDGVIASNNSAWDSKAEIDYISNKLTELIALRPTTEKSVVEKTATQQEIETLTRQEANREIEEALKAGIQIITGETTIGNLADNQKVFKDLFRKLRATAKAAAKEGARFGILEAAYKKKALKARRAIFQAQQKQIKKWVRAIESADSTNVIWARQVEIRDIVNNYDLVKRNIRVLSNLDSGTMNTLVQQMMTDVRGTLRSITTQAGRLRSNSDGSTLEQAAETAGRLTGRKRTVNEVRQELIDYLNDDANNEVVSEGDPIFNPEDMNMLNRTTLDQMSVLELEMLHDSVMAIRKLGMEELEMKKATEREELDNLVEEVTQNLGGGVRKDDEIHGSLTDERTRRNVSKKNYIYSLAQMPTRIFDMLDGYKNYKGRIMEIFYGPINEARNQEIRAKQDRFEAMKKVMDSLFITERQLGETFYTTIDEGTGMKKEFSLNQAIYIYSAWNNERQRSAMVSGNGITPKMYAEIANKLTVEHKALGIAVMKDYENNRGRYEAAVIDYANIGIEVEPNYLRMFRANTRLDRPSPKDNDGLDGLITEIKGANKSRKVYANRNSSISRKIIRDEYQQPIVLGLFDGWQRAVNEQEHFTAFAKPIKRIQQMLEDKSEGRYIGLRETLINKYGNDLYDALKGWVNRVANPNFYKAFDVVNSLPRAIRSNAAIAYLSFNPLSALKNATSWGYYLKYSSSLSILQSWGRFLTSPRETIARVWEYDPQVKEAQIDRYFEELAATQRDGNTKYSRLRLKMMEHGTKLLKWSDMMSRVVGWDSVYHYEMERGASHEEAVKRAQIATINTQNNADPKDLPSYMASNEFLNMMVAFTNQTTRMFGMLTHDIYGDIKNGRINETFANIMGFSMMAIILASIDAGEPPEDTIEAVKMVSGQALGQVPLVGASIMSAMNYRTGGTLFDTFARYIADSLDSIGKGDFADSAKNAYGAASLAYGLPYTIINRAIKAAKSGNPVELFININRSKKPKSPKNDLF